MSEDFLATVVRDGPAALLVCDRDGVVTLASNAACRLLAADPTGLALTSLLDPSDDATLAALIGANRLPARGQAAPGTGVTLRLRVPGAAPVQLRVEGTRILDGASWRPVVVLVASGHLPEGRSPRLDTLTGVMGVLGRESFVDQLRIAVAGAGTASMAIVALDGFKMVNDLQGHAAADEVLRAVAAMLREHLPGTTSIGRLADDEFGCFFPGRTDQEVADLLHACQEPVRSATTAVTGTLPVTYSAGVATLDGTSAHAVLRRADVARLQAKAQGRALVIAYGPASEVWRLDREQTAQVVAALHDRAQRMRDEARTDALTGLANLRALEEEFARMEHGRRATDRAYAMLFVDADRFGLFNHVQGSAAGDAALRLIAQVLPRHGRLGDRAFRKGGEEFVVVLHGADLAAGLATAEQVRADVEALGIPHGGAPDIPLLTVTVGVGAATPGLTASQVCDAAGDRAYAAKDAGRRNSVAGP